MESIKDAARAATSKPVQRAVVNSVLLAISAATLFGFASIATALFFQNYLPEKAVSSPLYLQYGITHDHPYGIATLSSPQLKTEQEYDISVTLSMPKSPVNMERGNFMVRMLLIGDKGSGDLAAEALEYARSRKQISGKNVLYKVRRPALAPYSDPMVSLVSRLLWLGYHVLFPASQAMEMSIQLAERVSFAKDALVPASAYVEVEAGGSIQIYKAAVTLTAQLRGLRWAMHHYRIVTFTIFTVAFWLCEILFMSAVLLVWLSFTANEEPLDDGKSSRGRGHAGSDDDDDSDEDDGQHSEYSHRSTQRTKSPNVKEDPDIKEEESQRQLADIPTAAGEGEADDEDDFDEPLSSATQTGYKEKGKDGVRKRSSKADLQ
ncbi:hypothetical protein VHEMI06749 [[Torrubiella] hemipterigena]|uniref:Tubulin-tyrosine ligase n=2 Tax=[Torrubiella] hemipterigena TaxID=1531966 RepID=A0A0A1T886_9HYPO|nr:hypothetical protein VHEMI06749 [[Torrubiella] hemipterigena]